MRKEEIGIFTTNLHEPTRTEDNIVTVTLQCAQTLLLAYCEFYWGYTVLLFVVSKRTKCLDKSGGDCHLLRRLLSLSQTHCMK